MKKKHPHILIDQATTDLLEAYDNNRHRAFFMMLLKNFYSIVYKHPDYYYDNKLIRPSEVRENVVAFISYYLHDDGITKVEDGQPLKDAAGKPLSVTA